MGDSMSKEVQVTTASEKGQVVIPQGLREELGIKSGTKFAVYGRGDTIVFKRLEMPTVRDFERLAKFGRTFAKQKGIKEKNVLEDD